MAEEDGLFEEDIAPDEEVLGWEATDEGIEIALDCTKCSAWNPFTIEWEELIKLGEGGRVKGFARVGSELHYRYTCPHCLNNYLSANYNERDAHKEATSTLKISLAEFDAWHRQALGRLNAAERQRQIQAARAEVAAEGSQPVVQRPVSVQQQPQVPVAPAPVPQPAPQARQHPNAQQAQRQPRRRTIRLTAAEQRAVNEFVRKMVQEGYSQEYVLAAKKNFMKELILARSTPAAPATPQRVAQNPAAQGGMRKMRLKDGRIVLVNSENRIVRVLN